MDVINLFDKVNVKKGNLYKPVLLLFALKECYFEKERLISFKTIDTELQIIFKELLPSENYQNFHYAFGRLENDNIWEVTNSSNLKRSSSGDVSKSELIEKNITGGFLEEIYQELLFNKSLITDIYNNILNIYFDKTIHADFLQLLESKNNNREKRMALMSNEGEPVSRWWVAKGIKTIRTDREIFSSSNMRRARNEFIAGANRLGTIKSWLLAAQLIKNGRNTKEHELTDFGFAVLENDPNLEKSSTWWAFHLAICFSFSSEPYLSFFINLDSLSKDWINNKQLSEKILNSLKNDKDEAYKESTIESLLGGVRKMFEGDRPLADLGLIETRKNREEGILIRLGSPKLTDEIILHALAMSRFHNFKSRSGIDFSELSKIGLHHYLCCSPEQLRHHLRRMNQSHQWQNYFSFNEAVNLDSIAFADDCDPRKTLLLLLQQGKDTWL